MSTVINVCWRNNAALLAKQLSSVTRMSGGRLTAGLGMGAWPADYEASGVPQERRGRRLDDALATMRRTWDATGDRPRIMVGGGVRASYARAASDLSDGWVAPLFALSLLRDGVAATEEAWARAGRHGRPRILTGRYFSLGPDAAATADAYIHHYYGDDYFDFARADTLTDAGQLRVELRHLADAGCTDVLLYPCAGDLEQVGRLYRALYSGSRTIMTSSRSPLGKRRALGQRPISRHPSRS